MRYEEKIKSIKDIAYESMKNGSIITVYPNYEDDFFVAGIVQFVTGDNEGNSDAVLLNCISPYGLLGGYALISLEYETKIFSDNEDTARLEKLRKINNISPAPISLKIADQDDLIYHLLLAANKSTKCVSIYLHTDTPGRCFSGRVLEISRDRLKIEDFDKFGHSLGVHEISLEKIWLIFYGTIIEETLDKLIEI